MPIKNIIQRLFTLRKTRQELKNTSIELNKYRLILDQTPIAVYIINKEMCFEYVNPSFTIQSGYTKEELLNKHINETIYKSWGEIPENRKHIAEALANGNNWEGELYSNHKDGHKYWANTIASPYKNEKGEVDGYVIIQQDITESKKLELVLKESENLYRTLIENSLDAVVLTQDFKFIYYNKVFLQLLGYTNEEMILVDPLSILASEDREKIMNYHVLRMKGEIFDQDYIAHFVRRDGSKFLAEMKATSVTYNGKPASFITMRDVTELKQMQQALTESESQYRNLVEQALDGITITQDRNLVFANQAFCNILEYSVDEVIGMPVMQAVSAENLDDMNDMFRRIENGEKFSTYTTWNAISKSGKIKNVELHVTVIEYKGRPAFLVITRDITERLKMQQAIRESETKYKALVENSQDGITIIRDNKYLFANKTYCKMLGYSPEELYEIPAHMTVHPDDRAKALEQGKRRRNLDFSTSNDVYRMLTKSGEVRECETTSTLVEFGGIWASFFTSHDITESKRMQEALAKSERRFRELTELLPQAVYELDVNNRPTFMNKTGREMFKMDEAGYSGKLAYEFFSPEDKKRMREALELEAKSIIIVDGEIKAHPSRPMEYTAYRSDGSTFPVIIYGAPIFENGQVTGSRGIIVDISERKSIEDKLRQSEEKYRLLFEAESDAIFMIDAESGQILDVNPAASIIYGYSREEFLQMKNTDVSAEPEETEAATKRRDTKVILRYHKKKDGTVFPVELSAGFTLFKGQKIQIVTSRDITENKKMQDALSESEQRFRELTDLLPQTIYELDTKGNLLYCNKAGMEMFGLTEDDYGKPRQDSFVPEDRERNLRNIILTMSGQRSEMDNEYTAISRSGRRFPVLIYGVPMFKNGKVTGFRGMIIDITERKATEQALKESEEKYRSLIENANDGILITQNGLLKFANQAMCEMMQYSPDELFETPFLNYVPEDDHQIMISYHKRRMAGENFNTLYRSRIIQKSGNIIHIELNARTLPYNNHPAAFIIVRDITERVNMENELKQAKVELEMLNKDLETRVFESSQKLTETRTQLINLQKENLQSQFEVLRQQVNPHFLFNSLNVLTSLIKLEPDLAEQFSEHLSKVYRYVLENKDNELVDLHTELRFLDAYIFLLNIRFIDKIKVNINIPEEKRIWLLIPLAMQLLIENAIKHNIMTKTDPLIIDIFIDTDNYLNIINNLQERPSQLISTGVGLKNIQNRYLLLNNTQPVFEKTETHFVAKVPLVLN